jgi:hypothetical protein
MRRWTGAAAAVCAAALLAGCGGGGDAERVSATSDQAQECRTAMEEAVQKVLDSVDMSKGVEEVQKAFEQASEDGRENLKVCDDLDKEAQEKLATEVQTAFQDKLEAKVAEIGDAIGGDGSEKEAGEGEGVDKSGLELLNPKVDAPSFDDVPGFRDLPKP